jgi:hypothetical protein
MRYAPSLQSFASAITPLYIHPWKSFIINQNLYIQNRKPFVLSVLAYAARGC